MAKKEQVVSEDNVEEKAPDTGATDEALEEVATEDLLPLLEDARAKADEHWNLVVRVKADMDNARRRSKLDVENAHKFALEKFAQELLPVTDSLEMGLAAIYDDSDAAVRLKEGTQLTLKMLVSALEKFGIESINPLGEAFDPDKHQAMSMQESAEHKPNTVIAVMQKGYELNGRLLRPAMVVVSKAAANTEEGNQINEQA